MAIPLVSASPYCMVQRMFDGTLNPSATSTRVWSSADGLGVRSIGSGIGAPITANRWFPPRYPSATQRSGSTASAPRLGTVARGAGGFVTGGVMTRTM